MPHENQDQLNELISKEGHHYEVDLSKIPMPRLTGHSWRQFGNMLLCQSCPNEHSQFIHPSLGYFGNDKDGKAIIKKR